MNFDGKLVREKVGKHEQRWRRIRLLLLWACLSLVLWGLIVGGLYLLF